MASNLRAMASILISDGLHPNSDSLQPTERAVIETAVKREFTRDVKQKLVEVTVEAFKFSISYSVESCVRLISTFQMSENSGQTHIFFTNAGKARLILGNTTKQQLQFPCLAAASTTFFPLMVSIDCPMGGLLFFHRLKEKVEAARRP